MARLRLRCYDPHSPWPPGLVKEYDEGVARELLRMSPYYVEVSGALPDEDALRLAADAAEKMARLHQTCQSCAERREANRLKALGNP